MHRGEKEQAVAELNRRVGGAKCLYLTDFTGLDVASMTELRAKLSGADVEYVVVKNTLARRALAETPYAELTEHLVGPNAFAMSTDDVVTAARILTDFAKDTERPKIKAGAIEGRVISLDEIRRIAQLPPREELLAQMVGYARAPIAGLVYTLNGLLSKFVRTLDAVRAQREASGGTAPEEVPEAVPEEAPEAVSEEAPEAAAPEETPEEAPEAPPEDTDTED